MIRATRMTWLLATAALGLAYSVPASAQATRTWVEGTGDDVNPCSRTAPCKTFAGAIVKTAAGGEINCIDAGGFGTVTITKSITIDCSGTLGSILNAGTNGVNINDSGGGTINVILRGISINGAGTGLIGVNFISGHSLTLEHVIVTGNKGSSSDIGVKFAPSTAAALYLNDVTVTGNGVGTTGGGVFVQPTGLGSASVSIRDSRVQNNANNGLRLDSTGNTGAGITVSFENSQSSGNAQGIAVANPSGTATLNLMIADSTLSNNSSIGIVVSGGATARVGNTTITANGTGVAAIGATASILSYGDNRVDGNTNDGAFSGPVTKK